mmetsp:Transcript_106535/g.217345  ORF Transcript_106535/g.217345 Transcript_106535/m.217345 type:complete len:239 (-) Transcript_106535:971-1687(-)
MEGMVPSDLDAGATAGVDDREGLCLLRWREVHPDGVDRAAILRVDDCERLVPWLLGRLEVGQMARGVNVDGLPALWVHNRQSLPLGSGCRIDVTILLLLPQVAVLVTVVVGTRVLRRCVKHAERWSVGAHLVWSSAARHRPAASGCKCSLLSGSRLLRSHRLMGNGRRLLLCLLCRLCDHGSGLQSMRLVGRLSLLLLLPRQLLLLLLLQSSTRLLLQLLLLCGCLLLCTRGHQTEER